MKEKKVLALIVALVVTVGITMHPDASPGPGKVKTIKCTKATTATLTIKYKAKGAKKYQVRYRKAGTKKWIYKKYRGKKTFTKKSMRLKLAKKTDYQIQVRGVRGSKKGKWTTRKYSTPYIRISAKVNGVSFLAANKKTHKTYYGKTNAKGIVKISVPVGSYTVKFNGKSGYVSAKSMKSIKIYTGKNVKTNWTVKKETSSNTNNNNSDNNNSTNDSFDYDFYYSDNADSNDIIKKVLDWNEQQQKNNIDFYLLPSPGLSEDSSNSWETEILNKAKNTYGITSQSSDFDKILYVARAECDILNYDWTPNLATHTTACSGYANCYHDVLTKLGVPCYIRSGSHTWNVVKLNGKYYNCDVSMMDHGGESSNKINYAYSMLLLSDIGMDEHSLVSWLNDNTNCPIECVDKSYESANWSWKSFFETQPFVY